MHHSKLNPREAAICDRIRELRKRRGLTQYQLAEQLGLKREGLINYEYKRAPLTWEIAWRMNDRLRISLLWLATGAGSLVNRFQIPHEYLSNIEASGRFSTAFDSLRSNLEGFAAAEDLIAKLGEAFDTVFCKSFDDLLARPIAFAGLTPPGVAPSIKAHEALSKYILLLSKERDTLREALAMFRDFHRGKPLTPEFERVEIYLNSLTSGPGLGRVLPVKRSWKELRETIASLTEKRGAKAELARQCGVSPQAVSEWMLGKSMPSADVLLRYLLPWVEGVSKKNDPSAAVTAPGSSTQPKKGNNETKQKSGRREN